MKNSKRKLTSILLAVLLVLSLTAPASAADCRTLRCRLTRYVQTIRCQLWGDCSRPVTPAKPEADPPAKQETTPPASVETPTVPSDTGSTVSDYEKAVAALVNEQRAAYGLAPLTLSASLSDGARLKSKDMATKHYFSHTSPTYGSPFEMMRSLGITYRTAGENIAVGYASPDAVVKAWMASEGHRANILSANYTTIGVGYIASGNYWTQWFLG